MMRPLLIISSKTLLQRMPNFLKIIKKKYVTSVGIIIFPKARCTICFFFNLIWLGLAALNILGV